MKTSNVFKRTLIEYNNRTRYILNVGGSRSGKSYSILQLLYLIARNSKTPKYITIVSKTLTHLKDGVMKDFEGILKLEGYIISDVKNVVDSSYTFGNSVIKFVGADNEGRVTGPMQHITYINEGNFVTPKVAEQLAIRTEEVIFVDMNPSGDSWVDDYMDRDDTTVIHSTYKDNPYLKEAQIKDMLERGRRNEFFQRVYVDGLKGRLDGAIYSNWKVGDFDENLPSVVGVDFGFNDPDAIVRVAINEKKKIIYAHEELKQNGLSTDGLINKIKTICKGMSVYADAAEPRLISDIRSKGVNIRAAKKGKGSILSGIKLIQGYEIIVSPTSKNLMRELETYIWSDKKSGVPLSNGSDHLLDALRYAATMIGRKGNGVNIKIY